jgi:hypothetical protein
VEQRQCAQVARCVEKNRAGAEMMDLSLQQIDAVD